MNKLNYELKDAIKKLKAKKFNKITTRVSGNPEKDMSFFNDSIGNVMGSEAAVAEGAEGKRENDYEYVIYRNEKPSKIVAIRSTRTEAEFFVRQNDMKFENGLNYERVSKGKFKRGDSFYGSFDDDFNLKEACNDKNIVSKIKSIFKKYDEESLDYLVVDVTKEDDCTHIQIRNDVFDYYDAEELGMIEELNNLIEPNYFEPYDSTTWNAYCWE